MKIKNILNLLFVSVAIIFETYFGIFSIVSFLIQVILIAVISAMVMKAFPFGKKQAFSELVKRMAIFTTATIGFFLSIFLVFTSYHTFVPGKLSDITVSNGKQTVVFLQMSHIATPEFYQEKQKKLQSLEKQGYTFLVEGVRPGSQANEKSFSESLGFEFTPTLYTTIASFIDLQAQDNKELFSGISSGVLVSVDVSIDDFMQIIGTGSLSGTGTIVNIEDQLADLQGIGTNERLFAGFVIRSFMNLVLKQTATIEDVMMIGTDPRVFSAILDKRNETLIQYILAHPEKKIAIAYGALHFEGVFAALERHDPSWKVTSVTSYTPYNP